ncbi:response regulator transcription factor [Dyella sp. M7H15-1]|uniref:response regulator transcription factor n=1 Tax=Dyella sp. M7H15-1 TaxID=2501295 RepID=UPI001005219B|nr:response regulator transcription factor [Dyella sp. M7H15-1]QAU23351.1 response regulator transcription factor [Dyella sp. M7H15-1]
MTDNHPPSAHSITPPPHVFVLEDNTELRQDILLPALREHGFQVQGAATATELYRTMLTQHVDMIVLDVGLPDEDGFSVARHLRTISDIGIVVLTGHTDRQHQLDALKSGADFYLPKPVDLDVLAITLKNLARRIPSKQHAHKPQPQHKPSTATHWRLEAGGWRLVSPRGKSVVLTASEQCVTTTLATERGSPVSRDLLIRALSRNVYDFDPHRLEMMIHRLRRKVLANTGETLPLITVRGSGYLFTCDGDSSVLSS